MTEKTMATTSAKAPPTERDNTRAQERYMQPPVDIYEGPKGLVLTLHLPRAEKAKPRQIPVQIEAAKAAAWSSVGASPGISQSERTIVG